MNIDTTELSNYYRVEDFYNKVQTILQSPKGIEHPFVLLSLDFDNFNFINDFFGYHVGDQVLQRITEHFSAQLTKEELFSRLHADHFAFLVTTAKQCNVAERFCTMTALKEVLADILPTHYSLVSSGGIVYINEYQNNLSALLDKANFARKQAKGTHIPTFLPYDEKMGQELEWRKSITMMMESALQQREFEMYLQPKVLLKNDQIAGAEALVRWNSKKYGMIYPDRFIPILEQNGFIQQLDFFILEEACRFLQQSVSYGIVPLTISVNFSKVHIRSADFVDRVFHTVNQYGISTKLIEIEFTENIYLSDFQALLEIVSAFKYLGFKVALDDFGSAYSSLNYLKDLPLDIIKIDKGFLKASTNNDKGRMIIAKVVELIKSMRMLSVMEGVETEEQVEFLQKLSCDFGQGYFYAKPMTKEAYIAFVKDKSSLYHIENPLINPVQTEDESYQYIIPQEFQMDNWELYTLGKNIDMGLMKGYLDGEVTVQYVNDRALEYLGYTRQEFRENFHNSIVAFTHPEDIPIVQANAKQLIDSGKPLQFRTRAIRKDGKVIFLQGCSSCVIDSQGRPTGIYAFQDVTEELERTEALRYALENKITQMESILASERKMRETLRLSEERYRLIVEQSNDIMFDWDFVTDTILFSNKYKAQFGLNPLQNAVSTNPAIRTVVHPDDLEAFEQWVKNTYKVPGISQMSYRLQTADGSYLRVRSLSTSINDHQGVPIKAVGVFSTLHE